MSEEKWALIRKRVYMSIPFVRLLLAGTTVAITDSMWEAIIGLSAVWLVTSGTDVLAARHVDVELAREIDATNAEDRVNVSRETSHEIAFAIDIPIPLPCAVVHGSADAHIPSCEGWSNP